MTFRAWEHRERKPKTLIAVKEDDDWGPTMCAVNSEGCPIHEGAIAYITKRGNLRLLSGLDPMLGFEVDDTGCIIVEFP